MVTSMRPLGDEGGEKKAGQPEGQLEEVAPPRVVKIGSQSGPEEDARLATAAQIDEVYGDPAAGKLWKRPGLIIMAPGAEPPVVAPNMHYESDRLPTAINNYWHTITLSFPDEAAYELFYTEVATFFVPQCARLGYKLITSPENNAITIKREAGLIAETSPQFLNRLQLINKPPYAAAITVVADDLKN